MEIYVLRNLVNDHVTAHMTVAGAVREMLNLPASVHVPSVDCFSEIEEFVRAHGWERRRYGANDGLILTSAKTDVDYQLCSFMTDAHDTQWIGFGNGVVDWQLHRVVEQLRNRRLHLASPLRTIEDLWFYPDLMRPAANRGHPDEPAGAAFENGHRLYRRTPLPDTGPAYCAAVVQEVAADGVPPVVGVPELVAAFL